MNLVIPVPPPAAGAEWSYMVPGQYVQAITAVTATLAPKSNPVNATDSSGNGNNAPYNGTIAGVTYGVTGPFGGGGGLAVQRTNATPNGQLALFANAGGTFDTADFSCEAIIKFANSGSSAFEELICERSTTPDTRFIFGINHTGPTTANIKCANSNSSVFDVSTSFSNAAFHHIAVTQTGGTWTPYVDGVAGTAIPGKPINTLVHNQPIGLGGDQLPSTQIFCGQVAALAYFGSALSGAQIAAHVAAISTSSAAYKTAVLADSPIALWMLDDQVQTFQRAANLQVTDGTHVVARFPAFGPAQQSPVFNWAWVSNAASNVQTPDQTVTTVAIPELVLPPGYTIGSQTPDISTLDQWSNIEVWTDSTYTGSDGGGFNPYAFESAKLIYQQQQGG